MTSAYRKTVVSIAATCIAITLSATTAAGQSCLQQTYSAQVGVRERTGHNDGSEVELYLRTCGLGPGYAWCAAFVKWCYMQCSIDTRGMTAWAASCINTRHIVMRSGNAVRPGTAPEAGDNITFWDYTHQRVAHTGLYDHRINDTFYESVEGNTNEGGSAEGDGVYRKRRSYRATYIISRWK